MSAVNCIPRHLLIFVSILTAFTCSSKDLPDVRYGSFVCDELANICTLQCNYGYYPSSATEISCTYKQSLTDAWEREFTCTGKVIS